MLFHIGNQSNGNKKHMYIASFESFLSSTMCIYTFQSRTAKMHYSVEIHGYRTPTITTIMNDAKYLQRLATTIEGTALYTVLFTAMLALKFKLSKGAPNLYYSYVLLTARKQCT
jgi:hypothetical protein